MEVEPLATAIPNGGNGSANKFSQDGLSLHAVSPSTFGEGLPYAPIDWPKLGDKWRWRVGRRFSKSGYYNDYFLYPPERIQKSQGKRIMLASKPAIIRFIQEGFPDADLDAFFSSFTMKVPASTHYFSKGNAAGPCPEAATWKETDEVKEGGEKKTRQKKRRWKTAAVPVVKHRHWQAAGQVEDEKIKERGVKQKTSEIGKKKSDAIHFLRRRTRQSWRQKFSTGNKDSVFVIDSSSDSEGTTPNDLLVCAQQNSSNFGINQGGCNNGSVTSSKSPSPAGPSPLNVRNILSDLQAECTTKTEPCHSSASKNPALNQLEESPTEATVLDFDECIKYVDNFPSQHLSKNQAVPPSEGTPALQEFGDARIMLSSLLLMNLSSLISPNNLTKLSLLVSKLQNDPTLTATQFQMLRLVEAIPKSSEDYLGARKIIEQADEFFSNLQNKAAEAISLKNEYNVLKARESFFEAEIVSDSQVLEDLDKQIAKLQSQRADVASGLVRKKATLAELLSVEKRLSVSLPVVVSEIQAAERERPEWDMKKKDAAKQEAEMICKFAPLQRFSF